jgi:hypothetical protein
VKRLEIVTVACFVLLAGVLLLFAFVVCGLFVLLTPEALGRDPD